MTLLFVLVRALHIGSALLLVSLLFFQQAILRDNGALPSHWQRSIARRLRKCVAGTFVVHLLSGAAWCWIVTAMMNDSSLAAALDGELLRTVLLQTQFGQLWVWRAGFALALGVAFFKQRDRIALFLSALLLLSLTWAAHAAAGTHERALHIAVDLAHLGLAAIWPVGLIPLALFLRAVSRIRDSAIVPILLRFSRVSLIAVTLLFLTGFANALFFIPTWSSLITTTYGQLLVGKIALFLIMISLGALNRLSFLPALESDPTLAALTRLRRIVILESALGLIVILIVGAMGATSPPS
jgi:putative copper resistance protein D